MVAKPVRRFAEGGMFDDDDDDDGAPLGGAPPFKTQGYGGALQDSGGYMSVADPATGVPIPSMSGMTAEQLKSMPAEIQQMMREGREYTRQGMTDMSALQQKQMDAVALKRKTLEDAYEKLVATKPDNSALLLALGTGLMAPTRTGSFGESLSNAGQAALPQLNNRTALEEARRKHALDYRLGIAGTDAEGAKIGYEGAKSQATIGRNMTKDALSVLQRNQDRMERARQAEELARLRSSLKTPQVQASPFAKAALAELGDEHIDPTTMQAKTERGAAAIRRFAGKVSLQDTVGTQEDQEHFASEYGVPIVPPEASPYRGTANADARWQAIQRTVQKKLEDADATGTKATKFGTAADRFIEINQKFPHLTGRNVGTWQELQKAARGDEEANAIAEMQSLSTLLSREQRQSGEGPMTDSDAAAFERMIFNPKNNLQANTNIARAFQERAKLASDYARFMNDYNSVHQHLGSAYNEWQKYAKANPILVTDKKGNYALNENRKSYQDYFRLQNEKARLEREIKASGGK